MNSRVIVIGGGAAGAWSALAARRAGADVCLVRQAPGASALSSGCFDFAVEPDAEGTSLPADVAASSLSRRRPWHPYAQLGAALPSAVEDAVRFLVGEHTALGVRGSEHGAHVSRRNLLLATPFGTLKETLLAQGPIAAGDLGAWSKTDRIGVASVANRAAFDASMVVAGLVSAGFDAVALPVVYDGGPHTSLAELSGRLDESAVRQAFVARVSAAAAQADVRLVLLPVAGMTTPLETLAEFTSVRAAELMSVPPSVPGLRFDNDLERALVASGVARVNAAVQSASIDDTSVRRLVLDDGHEVAADAIVLATGRFIGGGIRHTASGFRETVFDLPVFVDGRQVGQQWLGELLSRDASADQAALRAGVRVDAEMRPTDHHSRPRFMNVFAAGSVIGGFDPAKDRSGLGAVAVTALVAGRAAARVACQGSMATSGPSAGARS